MFSHSIDIEELGSWAIYSAWFDVAHDAEDQTGHNRFANYSMLQTDYTHHTHTN